MSTLNEIKEQKLVVKSVGGFADSLQQIAAGRMVKLRRLVEAARRFVDEATIILKELELERAKKIEQELGVKKSLLDTKVAGQELSTAIIVITSDQGLCGSYNSDIIKKIEVVVPEHKNADYFIIGKKGQEAFRRIAKKYNLKFFPFNVPEQVHIEDLRSLINMFYHYDQIFLIYSKYINTATREVVFIELAVPHVPIEEVKKEVTEGKYIFEPTIEDLIVSVTAKLRYALFRQQLLDSKLSLYTAQMLAMKTASDNAVDLLKDLQLEYNKARRKMIDKKIQEVQAGRALWANE